VARRTSAFRSHHHQHGDDPYGCRPWMRSHDAVLLKTGRLSALKRSKENWSGAVSNPPDPPVLVDDFLTATYASQGQSPPRSGCPTRLVCSRSRLGAQVRVSGADRSPHMHNDNAPSTLLDRPAEKQHGAKNGALCLSPSGAYRCCGGLRVTDLEVATPAPRRRSFEMRSTPAAHRGGARTDPSPHRHRSSPAASVAARSRGRGACLAVVVAPTATGGRWPRCDRVGGPCR
jgi:hypothetical protein